MKKLRLLFGILLLVAAFVSCNDQSGDKKAETITPKADSVANITEEKVSYAADGRSMNGYIDYDKNKEGKRPGILVVHEWWGLTDYPRTRAKELAELGYIALAVDMFGNGAIAANPEQAKNFVEPFYKDPMLAKIRIDAAIAKLKSFPQTDTSKIAAIGYCYGGFVVLNAAKLGSGLDAVVSFHGDLSGVAPQKGLKTKILVCHGAADQFVTQEQTDAFKKSMDSVGADYIFTAYPGATHAFTNPGATGLGKKFKMPIEYNAAADTASWNDMKAFFQKNL